MGNNLITIIYSTNRTNLGVTPLFYNWLKEPLWQHMYNMFRAYSNSVIVLGLDTIQESDDVYAEIKKVISKTNETKVFLVDISLAMLSEDSINRILNINNQNILSVKKEYAIVNLNDRNYETEYYKYLGCDLVNKNLLMNANSFTEMYDAVIKSDNKLFQLPYDETFKLNNKKDAAVLKYLSNS